MYSNNNDYDYLKRGKNISKEPYKISSKIVCIKNIYVFEFKRKIKKISCLIPEGHTPEVS